MLEKLFHMFFPAFQWFVVYVGKGKSSAGYSVMATSWFTLDYEKLGMHVQISRVISKNVRIDTIYLW